MVPHLYTKFEVGRPSRSEDMAHFSVSALINLMTLNFDLLTYKWNHASPVSWTSLLPIFILLSTSVFDLDSGTGRAGLTNVRTCSAEQGPPHVRGPHTCEKKISKSKLFISKRNSSE